MVRVEVELFVVVGGADCFGGLQKSAEFLELDGHVAVEVDRLEQLLQDFVADCYVLVGQEVAELTLRQAGACLAGLEVVEEVALP